ncbi:Gfo/Idh/MocA family oxidoreductase [Streptomyces decoyicus]|uniref:Gfo/Idh/MocA family oxidoreductase n=1 Tax=Streptomyces decoyicus TaxID=249567 RepID=A0ABZ1FDJ5_9ACTN|nr:Gfo/Idh/MocA family oxidoreductase [Streptomyces decoyicus]WSB68256.1 Gfo/Idh/MocA family oxidoreductase [Streptomyces decoyicus]
MTIAAAIVGYGSAGRQHAQAIKDSGSVELRAVVETDLAIDTAACARRSSVAEVLRDPRIDLVALCLPPGGRAELGRRVLGAGKALLVEKPPAMDVAELDDLLARAKTQQTVAAVMLQHRMLLPPEAFGAKWGPATTSVLEVSRPRSGDHYLTRRWRGQPEHALGGILAHLGVHYLDLACQLLGRPAEVRLLGRRNRLPGIDSRVAGTVRFESGAVLSFAVTSEAAMRSERLAVFGEKHSVVIENGAVMLNDGQGERAFDAIATPRLRSQVYREVALSIAAGEEPRRCSLHAARGVTMLLRDAVRDEGAAPC